MRRDNITVTFDTSDFGCLLGTLQQRLQETERHRRICGDKYSSDDAEMIAKFEKQLAGCIKAIEAAKEQYLRGVAH